MPNTTYAPIMTLENAKRRAKLLATIRAFFSERGVLEVTTPILSHAANTDVYIDSVAATFHDDGQAITGYLHTSPEFAMKRLLSVWQVSMYQLCQVFRDYEKGGRHNIEFTMLEWYRIGFNLDMLAAELTDLLTAVYGRSVYLVQVSYSQLFMDKLGVHPLSASIDTLSTLAKAHGLTLKMDSHQGWLDLLFSHLIEPDLGKDTPMLVIDYPPATAALARTATDKDGHLVARRFELYIDGIEIANAYDELASSAELERRFAADNAERIAISRPAMPIDGRLIAAADDLPRCSGIALGVDRLLMVRYGLSDIRQAIAITTDLA